MKKVIIFLMCILLYSAVAMAKVSGVCSNCHTMHASQTPWPDEWSPEVEGNPQPWLLATMSSNPCVGCHSSSTSSTYYDLGGCKVPVVLYTGTSEPTSYLAGGNFWWVKEGLGNNGPEDDTKGHNVFLGEPDDNLTEAPGRSAGCNNSCHTDLSQPYSGSDMGEGLPGKYGCQGCHLHPKHHANDHPNFESGLVDSADKGWYRFLSGHSFTGKGVKGYEYKDWEAGHPNIAPGGNAHNEYIGNPDAKGYGFQQGGGAGDGVTAFCTGCHNDFCPGGQGSSSPWLRHPSDAVIPNEREYQHVGGDSHLYDPLSPVAKPTVDTTPDTTVNPGTDMVMCLSCHRPHGSPYPDLLRWDYTQQIAGGGGDDKGCFYCHTQKN
ncbi:hypothetical protein DRQ11_14400 [candidate division KSB1 bacterium]|nr:MAG: hypothetical protein DRQ11_14400 [candidate division KSB1 bacterium]